MAIAGQVIRNPVTGEAVTFLVTAGDSGGKLLRIEMAADPKAAGATEHIHPRLTERYEMLEGRLHVRLDGEERVVAAGERLEIPRGSRMRSGTPTTRPHALASSTSRRGGSRTSWRRSTHSPRTES